MHERSLSSNSSPSSALARVARRFAQDRLLLALAALAVGLYVVRPVPVTALLDAVDWPTIATLGGLLLLTQGITQSGALARAGQSLVARLRTERRLALCLVLAAALLSMLLTNDVALFVVVPLTVGLRRFSSRLSVGRLVIFEALAVNAGSLATPIGNPQNILLWHDSGRSFAQFTLQMAPLSAALLALLSVATVLTFRSDAIDARALEPVVTQRRLFRICTLLYATFLALLAFGHPVVAMAFVFVCIAVAARSVLTDVDWALLAVFVMMFVDVHLVTGLGPLKPLLARTAHYPPHALFLAGIGWSQCISNVPAAILLLEYTSASKLIAYAVNVGGFGTAIGSLANLIALRLANERGLGLRFHLYSVPALLVSALVAWRLL